MTNLFCVIYVGSELLLLAEEEGSPGLQELQKLFTQLNSHWSTVTEVVYSRVRILKDASHNYGEFRGITFFYSLLGINYLKNNSSTVLCYKRVRS